MDVESLKKSFTASVVAEQMESGNTLTIDTIILNPQLEENYKVQSLFGDYKTEPFMRRRAYKKAI